MFDLLFIHQMSNEVTENEHQCLNNFSRQSRVLNFGFSARKQEIIKMTEQLIEAINNGDFDAYT